jgi:hypothetical protein
MPATAPSRATAPTPFAPAPGPAGACPDCGEPRVDPSAHFCEVCRYDFVARQPGPPPKAGSGGASLHAPSAPAARAVSTAAPVITPATAGRRWEIVVQTDAALDGEPDPDSPFEARPDEVVAVAGTEVLIGRNDLARDIHPEIALHDPGASRRHAKIVVLADGGLALQDLASTNGTRLNGQPVSRGGRSPLTDGDEILVGRWTRLKVRCSP